MARTTKLSEVATNTMKYKMHPKMKAKIDDYKKRKAKPLSLERSVRTRQSVTLEDLVLAAHRAGATMTLSLCPMRPKPKAKKKKTPIVYGES